MRAFLSALVAILFPAAAHAEMQQDEQIWLNLTAMGPISGDLLAFGEVQPRVGNAASGFDHGILRGAIGWKISPALSVYQGYAHIQTPGVREDVRENRSFQQISWTIGNPFGGELSSRTRLEQRWRSDGNDVGWRLREFIRYKKPLKQGGNWPNALVYSEIFVAFNDTDWGARAGFDQIRNFIGLEIPVGGASTVEAGYLNQFIDRRPDPGRPNADRMNHVASLALFVRY